MRLYARNTVSPRKKSTPLLTFTSHFQSLSPRCPQSSPLSNPQSVFQLGRKNLIRAHPITDTALHLLLTPSLHVPTISHPLWTGSLLPLKNLTPFLFPFHRAMAKDAFEQAHHQSYWGAKLLSHLALKLLLAWQGHPGSSFQWSCVGVSLAPGQPAASPSSPQPNKWPYKRAEADKWGLQSKRDGRSRVIGSRWQRERKQCDLAQVVGAGIREGEDVTARDRDKGLRERKTKRWRRGKHGRHYYKESI